MAAKASASLAHRTLNIGRRAVSLFQTPLESTLPSFVQHVSKHCQRLAPAAASAVSSNWPDDVLLHNLSSGKHLRGRLFLSSAHCLAPNQDQAKLTRLAWCIELLQAALLVYDDMIDGAPTRRGKPCWHRMPGVGQRAINDALLMESVINTIVKEDWRQSAIEDTAVRDIFDETKMLTAIGQHLDVSSAGCFDIMTSTLYDRLVTLKTAHYSIYLPLQLAFVISGRHCELDSESLRHFSYRLGRLFQIQDDYLDCFGDHALTGKDGTDIREGKCSWLLCTALGAADGRLRADLIANTGRSDEGCEAAVKQIYVDLQLPALYAALCEHETKALLLQLNKQPMNQLSPILEHLIERLRNRSR